MPQMALLLESSFSKRKIIEFELEIVTDVIVKASVAITIRSNNITDQEGTAVV